jgi:dihydroflavonol-4-reductase
MSRKRMFFSSAKAIRELGYSFRAQRVAFEDALASFRERGLLR